MVQLIVGLSVSELRADQRYEKQVSR